MTSQIPLRSSWLKRLWVPAVLAGTVTGCAGADPSDQTTTESQVGQAVEEWHRMNLCGGFTHRHCRHHEVCLPFIPHSCPGPRFVGICAPEPHWCPPMTRPVCGCDGNTYSNLCEAARAGVAIEHHGTCSGSGGSGGSGGGGSGGSGGSGGPGQPVCNGTPGGGCAGAGMCVDDPSDTCTLDAGGDCPGVCQCEVIQPCSSGEIWNDDPGVCACVPQQADPCAGVICPTGSACVVQPDGTTMCETP